ncbi:lipoyl synthase [Candidatus Termititenax dinenymphae]|uniref:Lipoyl synthase n=1 Tax=Candidatus Termititenax dinenymphae TaxID=2218523 RepID=A0A388TKV3_9BACT|nr:lipoyl synthase [Candidatus Termititenax dinenymphae]
MEKGLPEPLDASEPEKIAEAAQRLQLAHIVITSVTRDDLPDGGAEHFARTILAVRAVLPQSTIEVLTPDFQGNFSALDVVLSAKPDVFNHNVETVPRLYAQVRPQADYAQSLKVLKHTAQIGTLTKSGLMLGLGETPEELQTALYDLKNNGVSIVTLGQYLAPSREHYPVQEFIHPDKFSEYKEFGEKTVGLKTIFAGPFVRSSYMASDILEKTIV